MEPVLNVHYYVHYIVTTEHVYLKRFDSKKTHTQNKFC